MLTLEVPHHRSRNHPVCVGAHYEKRIRIDQVRAEVKRRRRRCGKRNLVRVPLRAVAAITASVPLMPALVTTLCADTSVKSTPPEIAPALAQRVLAEEILFAESAGRSVDALPGPVERPVSGLLRQA